MNVLISLHRGYGLGDAVQMSAVLQHVVKARPDWIIDYQAEEGRHQVGRGIVTNTFAYGCNPNRDKNYDAEVQICLYDTWANWQDRPNTRVSSCLHEQFGLLWDASCGRYRVDVSRQALEAVLPLTGPSQGRIVAVHYEGDSSPTKKNLTHEQAYACMQHLVELGHVPLLLDWRNTSPLTRYGPMYSGRMLTTGHPGWSVYEITKTWGGNAEMVCALISQCAAFIGIDSGPSKCASATTTPSLVVWTGHHPAPFHDPSPNTTHLVPREYHSLEPVCGDPGVVSWFEANHRVRTYESDPVAEVKRWLTKLLKRSA